MSKQRDEQQRILDALHAAHRERVDAKASMRAEIERQFEAKLYNLKLNEAKLMVEGLGAGIAKTKLGRAIGTTDWQTVQEMLELGRVMVPESVAPAEPKYSWGKVKEAVYTKGAFYAYLRIEGDDHEYRGNKDIPGDKGYVFFRFPDGRWVPADYNDPGEAALAWAAENPPE